MSKIGKEIILQYCNTIRTHSIDHLQQCLDNASSIRKEQYEYLIGCPSNCGLDEYGYEGLCYEDDTKVGKEMIQQCEDCWLKALEMKFD